MIRTLVVEDSAVVRDFLRRILGSDPDIEVVDTAADGEAALAAVDRTKPDVITMDVHMPGMNGFDVARKIMERRPTPIVIVTGVLDPRETTTAFRCLESGALAVILKPSGVGSPDHEQTAAELVRTVKLMSEVKVVRRWAARNVHTEAPIPTHRGASAADRGVAVVAVGASTGGPQALQSLLAPLPADFPAPILVVQHIAVGFTAGFAEWLARSSRLPVRVAAHGDVILPGRVYLAPENVHMKVGLSRRILLTEEEPENGLRPAVSVLFRSVAAIYGASAAAVLLSGMGKDGAYELKLLKDLGAVTIAQDRESSVVHGMPGEAIRLGGTTFVLSQEKIGPALARLAGE